MNEAEVRERYDALRKHVQFLLDRGRFYGSCIELDTYEKPFIDGDAWEVEARRLIE